MRQVVYSVAMSLDGYIAGPAGESDWIVIDPEIDFDAMFARFDVILMGRGTYEATRTYQGGSMSGIESYVFSRTLRQADCRGVTVSDNPSQTVSALKKQSGKDIWLRRWRAFRQLARARARRPSLSRDHPGPSRRRCAIAARRTKSSDASAGRAPALRQDGHGVAGVCGYPETS